MKEVINRQTIFISSNHQNDNATFNKDIFLDFNPDEVILRYFSFIPDQTGNAANDSNDDLAMIQCDKLRDKLIVFPVDNYDYHSTSFTPNIHFKITTSIDGIWNFTLTNPLNNNLSQIYGKISFCLEFIKYSLTI